MSQPPGENKKYSLPSSTSEAWEILSDWLQPSSLDARFWWHATGPLLATMLKEAGYSCKGQFEGMLFHYHVILSALGPRPTYEGKPGGWKSFMTDDFSPMELSWSWDGGVPNSKPRIRYSVEAIGIGAGSADDPFNQAATLESIKQLYAVSPSSDWQWFDRLSNAFQPPKIWTSTNAQCMPSGSNISSMFLGFEFQESGVGAKAYLAPTKAVFTGQSALEVISQGVHSLENETTRFPAYDRILEFLNEDPEGSSLEVLGIALDCVDPKKARLKLYLRSTDTSFNSVHNIMRMGGRKSTQSDDAMTDLCSLWQSVLRYDDKFSTTEQLRPNEHQTSGILYNFEIRVGATTADPKVYIPVKHYGTNDHDIALALVDFLKAHDRDRFALPYLRTLESFCVHRSLKDSRGLQTYIQCGLQNDSISLTSYLSPEIYHTAKWVN